MDNHDFQEAFNRISRQSEDRLQYIVQLKTAISEFEQLLAAFHLQLLESQHAFIQATHSGPVMPSELPGKLKNKP